MDTHHDPEQAPVAAAAATAVLPSTSTPDATVTPDKGSQSNLPSSTAGPLQNGGGPAADPEKVAFTPSKHAAISRRFKGYMRANVTTKWADLLLILCFFVSGLVDSVAFNVWSCFASMQTGMFHIFWRV